MSISKTRQPAGRKQGRKEKAARRISSPQENQRQTPPRTLELVLNMGPTLFAYVDADYRFRWVNQAIERWFRQSSENIRGRYLQEFLGEAAWQMVQPYVGRVLGGETLTFEQQLPLPQGDLRWVRATYTPDWDAEGHIFGFIVHAIDIGDLKQSEENLRREQAFSESAINSMPGIFYLFDRAGKFLRWNRNFEQVSEYSAQEIATMNPLDFFVGEDKGVIANAINDAFTAGQAGVEANFVSKSGQRIPYYFVGMKIFLGETPYLIGSGIDLSRRKEAEETQRATLNILEDFDDERAKLQLIQQATLNILEDFDEERQNFQLVQKATLNLLEDMHEERNQLDLIQRALLNMLEDIEVERTRAEQARVLLETVNKELEAFSYSVSHDLRAPLRAISGYAQAVVEDYEPRLDEEGKQFLGLIQHNAHKMGQLIDDLLTFSRLGRQQMSESQIDMDGMVRAMFAELAALAPDRNISLTVLAVPPAHGDQAMIRQVVVNLIANAIKFTRTREQALIEFGYLPEEGAYYVKDNGVGFDMLYVGKLFGVFQRLHAQSEFEGTGVGLALVYRIITRHGGRVWATGQEQQGASFFFTLPEREVV